MAKLTHEQLLERSMQHWRFNPLDWVADVFGDGIKLTGQQRYYFEELGRLIQAKYLLNRDGKLPADLAGYSRKIGLSIMAGKGVGKDFTAALTILFWMDVFPDCRVPCTANNAQQLQNVLWAEISSVMAKAKKPPGCSETILEQRFQWQSQKIYHKSHKETWFAEALAYPQHGTKEQQERTLTGRHSRFLLAVVDEAAGVPDAVYSPLETTLTGVLNLILLIFNPTQNIGFAIESQTTYQDQWVCFQWSQEDCPELIPKDIITQKEEKYGRDSNTFRVSVLGQPPHAGTGAFMPMQWIIDAMDREIEDDSSFPVIFGVDVGGGGDKSVICVRQGCTVLRFLRNNSKNTMDVVDWVAENMTHYEAAVAFVDIVGLGRGVYDRLRQMGYMVRPADARGKPESEDYFNNRSQWYMKMRGYFESGIISIPKSERDLFDQLNAIDYKPEEKNRIMSKDGIRKKLGGDSPDEADALALSLAGKDHLFVKGRSSRKIDYKKVFLR